MFGANFLKILKYKLEMARSRSLLVSGELDLKAKRKQRSDLEAGIVLLMVRKLCLCRSPPVVFLVLINAAASHIITSVKPLGIDR